MIQNICRSDNIKKISAEFAKAPKETKQESSSDEDSD